MIFGGIFLFVICAFVDANMAGGWNSFAKRYPATTRPAGKALKVLSGRFGHVPDSGRCVRVVVTDAGIYVYATFLRRLAHPPFLVPWASVWRLEEGYGFRGPHYVLEVKDAAGTIDLNLSKQVKLDLAKYYFKAL